MNNPLKEKAAQLFSKIDGKNVYYVFFAVLVSVLILDYFFLMRVQLSALKKINPEIVRLATDIKKAQDDLKRLGDYKKGLGEITQKFGEASMKVKSRLEVSSIMEYIAHVADETGIKIDQIMPETIDLESLTENDQRKYFNLPIYMEATGGYHDFGKFVARIEQNDISLRVNAFTIISTSNSNSHRVKLSFSVTIYEEKGS